MKKDTDSKVEKLRQRRRKDDAAISKLLANEPAYQSTDRPARYKNRDSKPAEVLCAETELAIEFIKRAMPVNTATGEPEETYEQFLEAKAPIAIERGYMGPLHLNKNLKPHAADIASWAIRGGNRAIFSSFGMAKTSIQLQICESLLDAVTGSLSLIVCPLGVRREFIKEHKAREFNLEYAPVYVATMEDCLREEANGHRLFLTNYERVRDGQIDPNHFQICTLDESAILRSFGSQTYQTFLPLFEKVPYKFVATATPSPNRFKELLHYAAFLGIMDSGQGLTRWFKRDSTQAGNLTLHEHKKAEFYSWLSTWGVFAQTPSDLGHDDTGYIRPAIEVIKHRLPVDHSTAGFDSWGQGKLLRNASGSISDAAREKRDSLPTRIECCKRIIEAAGPDRHWIIWHDLEDERRAIEQSIPGAVCISGTAQTIEYREGVLEQFTDGSLKILGTKPIISGVGSNFQEYCYSNIFLGIGHKFHDFIQALHRTQRFGQSHTVEAHLIYTESEDLIYENLITKWRNHNELHARMSALIREYGLSNIKAGVEMRRSIGIVRSEAKSELYTCVNNDCILEARNLPDNSIGEIITSIPFGNHYEYCESYNDLGHSDDDAHFFRQMDYLTPNLLRVLQPGRVAAIHVKDRIIYGSVSGLGMYSVNRFSDKTADHFQKHGFIFCGRITVVTDVVRENNQTYRLGFSENAKDGTKMGVGSPEYVLLFRKLPTDTMNAYADFPVTHNKPDCENPLCLCGHSEFEHVKGECGDDDCQCTEYCFSGELGSPLNFGDGRVMIPGTGYSRGRWQFDAHSFWRSNGNRLMLPEEMAAMSMDSIRTLWRKYSSSNVYNFEEHVEIAEQMEKRGILPSSFMALDVVNPGHPNVWDDITRMRTLNSDQFRQGKEMHVCPLQLQIIDRLIHRYSNPNDLIMDPFGGIGSVAYESVLKGRRGFSIELNTDYHRDALAYARAAEQKIATPTLFDALEAETLSLQKV